MKTTVIRSSRRRRTISARLVGETLEVRVPARLSEAEEKEWVRRMVARFEERQQRRALDDATLERRAQELNRRYFEGKLRWNAICWVSNQNTLNGSCTPDRGTIRISHHLAQAPLWVRDYVIVHELAHLLEPNHSSDFWGLVKRYPLAERARGYLMALRDNPPEGRVKQKGALQGN